MSAAPQHVRHPDRFFIGGEWVEPSSRSRIDVRDSATEEVFLSVAEAQVEDVDRAVAAARKAFDDGPWPRMTHAERAAWLERIADAWKQSARGLGEARAPSGCGQDQLHRLDGGGAADRLHLR